MMTPASGRHGDVANLAAYYLTHYVLQHDLGRVYAADTGFWLGTDPDTVRAPDAAFIRKDRVPKQYPKSYLRIVPDLVIEVISPDDRHRQVLDKVGQWLEAGCRLVWVVDPPNRTVHVYRPGKTVEVLHDTDLLDGEDVVPGFSLPVARIFQ